MKKITNILAIAILVIFAVACTDENDLENSKTNHVNLKTTSVIRPYASYEDVNFTDDEVQSMLDDFNSAINDDKIMPDLDIKTALFDMETHFNYGVVAKLPYDENAKTYETQTFLFTVPIESDYIDGNTLKNAYQTFVNSIISQMQGMNLDLSDMYVKEISSTSVTFGLDMEPLHAKVPWDRYLPAMRVFKSIPNANDVLTYIPSNATCRWDNLISGVSGNVSAPFIYGYSFDRLTDLDMQHMHVYTNINAVNCGPFYNYSTTYSVPNTVVPVIWNAVDLNDMLKKALIKANECNSYRQWGWVVMNYDPRLLISKQNLIGNNFLDNYTLKIISESVALLRTMDFSNLYFHDITTRTII